MMGEAEAAGLASHGPPPGARREWKRAFAALSRLAKDSEDTTQVFEIIRSLNGDALERTHRRMARTSQGRRILATKPTLKPLLGDHAYLEALPAGSLGRTYLTFMTEGRLTADGLVDASEAAAENDPFAREQDPELLYVGGRLVEMHDLWHVLTGYGRDDTGELANLWFSYGQFGQLGMGFIALMGSLDGPWEASFVGYMMRAYWRGRSARLLCAMPLEDMLALPLEEARSALRIAPPQVAHPQGILIGDRHGSGIGRGVVAGR